MRSGAAIHRRAGLHHVPVAVESRGAGAEVVVVRGGGVLGPERRAMIGRAPHPHEIDVHGPDFPPDQVQRAVSRHHRTRGLDPAGHAGVDLRAPRHAAVGRTLESDVSAVDDEVRVAQVQVVAGGIGDQPFLVDQSVEVLDVLHDMRRVPGEHAARKGRPHHRHAVVVGTVLGEAREPELAGLLVGGDHGIADPVGDRPAERRQADVGPGGAAVGGVRHPLACGRGDEVLPVVPGRDPVRPARRHAHLGLPGRGAVSARVVDAEVGRHDVHPAPRHRARRSGSAPGTLVDRWPVLLPRRSRARPPVSGSMPLGACLTRLPDAPLPLARQIALELFHSGHVAQIDRRRGATTGPTRGRESGTGDSPGENGERGQRDSWKKGTGSHGWVPRREKAGDCRRRVRQV